MLGLTLPIYTMAMDIFKYFKKVVDLGGSDLYVSAGIAPSVRVEGSTRALSDEIVTAEMAYEIIKSILNEEQLEEFKNNLELNTAVHVPDVGRFRVNVFQQRGAHALVARHVKTDIPSMEELGLPDQLRQLIEEKRGLILVVGGTGVGKSTTLASMISYRARREAGHILTIEDPIEFIHSHSKSIINQREVGVDTHTYEAALANALREAPDVIMIGEVRSADNMRHALSYAETGHLCVATLHANNASQALDRVINFFTHEAHNQIRTDISLFLKAIVAQNLVVGVDGKQIAIFEIMMNTPHVADLIHSGRIIEIKEAMDRSKDAGHKTFDDDLFQLHLNGRITKQEALRYAVSKNNLAARFRSHSRLLPTGEKEVEKKASYDKQADFSQYRKFRIKPAKISNITERNQVKALNTALLAAFEMKGLKYEKDAPDIDVHYKFELVDDDGLRLEETKSTSYQKTDSAAEAKKQLALNIVIKDTQNKKDVWRVQSSELTVGAVANQTTCNHTIAAMLDSYPTL